MTAWQKKRLDEVLVETSKQAKSLIDLAPSGDMKDKAREVHFLAGMARGVLSVCEPTPPKRRCRTILSTEN
jgi:hypothetical protein